MSILDTFKPKKLVVGSPFMTITENGISINKSGIDRLDYAEFVKILIDEKEKRVAIQICDANDPNKVQFVSQDKKGIAQYVRWNNREFVKQLMSWGPTEEFKLKGFKVPGEYLVDEKAFLFTFSEAIPF